MSFQCDNCGRICHGASFIHHRRLGDVCGACMRDLTDTDACEAEADELAGKPVVDAAAEHDRQEEEDAALAELDVLAAVRELSPAQCDAILSEIDPLEGVGYE